MLQAPADAARPPRRRRHVFGALVGIAVVFTLAVPDAVAADLRSPDSADAERTVTDNGAVGTDLRSPDAVEAAPAALNRAVGMDLRSPDTADAAVQTPTPLTGSVQSPDRQDVARPSVELVQLPAVESVRTVAVKSSGSTWIGVGIGAGALLALMLVIVGSFTLMHWAIVRPAPGA